MYSTETGHCMSTIPESNTLKDECDWLMNAGYI